MSTLNVHPEMSVSEAGWAMNGGPKIEKETWKMITHVKFNVMKPSAKKPVSPSKAYTWGQASELLRSHCGGVHTRAEPCTRPADWRQAGDKTHRTI